MPVTHLIMVSLFPKMKMGRNRVFEKMYEEKSDQDIEKRAFARQPHRLRNDVEERNRQHVAGAQRQKILQILARPIAAHHKIPANQIPRRRHYTQQRRQPHPKYQVMSHSEVAIEISLADTSFLKLVILSEAKDLRR